MKLLLLLCLQASATNFSAIGPNNQGVKNLVKENQYQAFQKFAEALAEDSFDPTIHFNLGTNYLANKESDKALSEYKMAEILSQNEPGIRFKALFNQAVIHTEKQDIPSALQAYQKALEILPDSKEVKTNIELLWKSMQGQGGGKGDQQKSGQNNGEGGSSENEEQKQGEGGSGDKKEEQKAKQPKPFESQDLSPETVRKVLEELKAQEMKVRSDHYSKGQKERPREKQW